MDNYEVYVLPFPAPPCYWCYWAAGGVILTINIFFIVGLFIHVESKYRIYKIVDQILINIPIMWEDVMVILRPLWALYLQAYDDAI